MGFFGALRRKAVTTRPGLEDWLDRQAAFLAQKSIYEYCRARSGVLSSKLFQEVSFKAALDRARWSAYPLTLRVVALMVEQTLRPHAGADTISLRAGLKRATEEVCRRYPTPPGFDAAFWPDAEARIGQRIGQAGLAAPRAVKDLPLEIADEFFSVLPIHPDLRGHDFELVTNNLRVNLCRAYEDFVAAAELPGLAKALLDEAREPEAMESHGQPR